MRGETKEMTEYQEWQPEDEKMTKDILRKLHQMITEGDNQRPPEMIPGLVDAYIKLHQLIGLM